MSRNIEIQGLTKSYTTRAGAVVAVKSLDLSVRAGEIAVLLGPSGCGKSSTLRCIAGLEVPEEGTITIGDTTVFSSSDRTFVQPEHRDIGMVFQSYALWPHMTVFENVAFPLRVRRTKAAVISEKVKYALAQVDCGAFERRFPRELSGGQQQRVALARAIVGDPSVLLLDEPLSNLDAKLREQLRGDLLELAKRLRLTAVYVTHDQQEAMLLGDKVAVMNRAVIEQLDSPREIYRNPRTMFVGNFLGTMNRLPGKLARVGADGLAEVATDAGTLRGRLPAGSETAAPGQDVEVCFRPHDAHLLRNVSVVPDNVLVGDISKVTYLGDVTLIAVQVAGREMTLNLGTDFGGAVGEQIQFELGATDCTVFVAGEQAVPQ